MVLSGRTEAFEPLILPYRQSLIALAYRITRNREEAKEVVQEAVLRAFKYLSRYNASRSFRNWLFRIAVNVACTRARKERREQEILKSLERETRPLPNPEAGHRSREFHSHLTACLSVLSQREREVFILRDIEEMNIKETARALHCSSISVRVNLSRARRKIRDVIRDRFPHMEEGQ